MSSWVFRSGRSLVSSGRRAVEADRRKMGWKPKRPKFEAEASCSRFGSRTAATWRGVTDDNDRNRVDVLMTSRDARHLDDANIAAAMIFLTFHREIDAVTVRNLLSTSFKKTDWLRSDEFEHSPSRSELSKTLKPESWVSQTLESWPPSTQNVSFPKRFQFSNWNSWARAFGRKHWPKQQQQPVECRFPRIWGRKKVRKRVVLQN